MQRGLGAIAQLLKQAEREGARREKERTKEKSFLSFFFFKWEQILQLCRWERAV
jgi:hypothetical protein